MTNILADFHALGMAVPATAQGNVPLLCPRCSHTRHKKRDRCLSVNVDTGTFKCWNCLWTGRVGGRQTYSVPQERPAPTPNEKHRRALQRTWDDAAPLIAGDPVTTYLASRGLCLPANAWPTALRFHAALRYYDDDKRYLGTYPAMLACIVDAARKPVSVHRTFLTADGRKAPVPKPRKLMSATVAGATSGGAIRLYPPGEVLAIAEGIETALSVHLMTGLPVWAAGSAGAIGTLIVPPEVGLTVICADHDAKPETCEHGAQKLVQRLAQEGRRAKILLPAQVGTDWNDVWQDATAERLSMARIEATPDFLLEPPTSAPAIEAAPDDPEAHAGVLAHHLPDYLRDHPDPHVRRYWTRAYRNANAFKRRHLQDPYVQVFPSLIEGATHDHA